jgi:hypothetical protein
METTMSMANADRTRIHLLVADVLKMSRTLQAETVKLQVETVRLQAEMARLARNARWYPAVAGVVFVGAVLLVAKYLLPLTGG